MDAARNNDLMQRLKGLPERIKAAKAVFNETVGKIDDQIRFLRSSLGELDGADRAEAVAKMNDLLEERRQMTNRFSAQLEQARDSLLREVRAMRAGFNQEVEAIKAAQAGSPGNEGKESSQAAEAHQKPGNNATDGQ